MHSSSNESAVNISTETDTVKRPFDEKEEVTPKKLKEDPSQSTKGLRLFNYFYHQYSIKKSHFFSIHGWNNWIK